LDAAVLVLSNFAAKKNKNKKNHLEIVFRTTPDPTNANFQGSANFPYAKSIELVRQSQVPAEI
jgi:hypothetical protein